jgi:hypothetical protein
MSTISNQRIRLLIDASQSGGINDVLTSATPQFWNGVDVQFELGIFYGSTLAAIDNIASITVDVKKDDPRTGVPLMSQTIPASALNTALTLGAWNGGGAADCHAAVLFANAQNQFVFGGTSETYWLVVSALTKDSPAHKIVFGATPVTVLESGFGTATSAVVATPSYYTAAQCDARFQKILQPSAPGSSGAAGVAGTIATDGSYLFICTAANTWKRISLATF